MFGLYVLLFTFFFSCLFYSYNTLAIHYFGRSFHFCLTTASFFLVLSQLHWAGIHSLQIHMYLQNFHTFSAHFACIYSNFYLFIKSIKLSALLKTFCHPFNGLCCSYSFIVFLIVLTRNCLCCCQFALNSLKKKSAKKCTINANLAFTCWFAAE